MADLAGVNGQRTEFKIVGKPNVPGKLSYNLASGKAKYGADATAPNMLHAKFLRSPYAYAVVKSVDISKVKALPGVVDVITWEDPDLKALQREGGRGEPAGAFLDNIADQEDAEVAVIVVAESEELCDEALRLLKVDWEVRPYIVDPREGMKPDAPAMFPRPGAKGNITTASKIDGDIEAGFKQADQTIEFDFVLPPCASHIPNPSGGMAYWYEEQNSGEGRDLYIEGATQAAGQVADLYKLPLDKVNQSTLYQGGKYCDWGIRKSQLITPLLARRTGRPVKCVNARADMYDFAINQNFVHARIGFKNDGLITAVKLYSIADNGSRGNSPFCTTQDMNYGPWYTTRCENIHQTMDAVSTNRGKMWVSGQHCIFGWDTMTIAEQMIADQLSGVRRSGQEADELAASSCRGKKVARRTDARPRLPLSDVPAALFFRLFGQCVSAWWQGLHADAGPLYWDICHRRQCHGGGGGNGREMGRCGD
jgi:CO/xanthine dehydrogenase Mo-binding subunit